MPAVQGLYQGFTETTAPQQTLVHADPSQVSIDATDTPGWNVYTVPKGASSQTLVFEVRTAGAELLYYPRASGADSFVDMAILDGSKPRSLARLSGKTGVWTPIGARWTIPLACFSRDTPLHLQVTLGGPWAQLWVRGKEAFF
jgi:hypothetical protein